jgi:putative oxidoreductase
MLLATMVVASVMHLQDGDGFTKSSHAIEAAIVFAALILIGPGRFAVQRRGK